MEFAVVWVTKNVEKNPQYKEDTEMYPHLIPFIEDEDQGFVVDLETGDHWKVDEFFYIEPVKKFQVVDT